MDHNIGKDAMRRTLIAACSITAFAISMVPIDAVASSRAYKKCVKSYGGERFEAQGEIYLGMYTLNPFRIGKGSRRQYQISRAIQKNCWPLLTPEELRILKSRAVKEYEREKRERPFSEGGMPK